jgi:hypothetical protein
MVTDAALCEWEKFAAWAKTEVREALQTAIDEIRRLTTCDHCEGRFDSEIVLFSDKGHRLIAGKRLCSDCYSVMCGKILDEMSCRVCKKPVREGLLYCAGLSDCWKKGVGLG